MKIIYKFLIIILFVAVGCGIFFVVKKNNKNQVCLAHEATAEGFKSNCFLVELATTSAQREQGLMNRDSLEQDKGMIFVFEKEGVYPFWMKNTLIPLDMIWIDENPSTGSGRVVFVAENVQPCQTEICPIINPKTNAKYVLEINGGLSKKLDIKVGDYGIIY
jgi:hypothetical protein